MSAVLLARGAASVVAPLTAVRDLECAEFVVDVHRELAAGEPVACAVANVRERWLDDDDLSRWAVASSFSCFGSGAVACDGLSAMPEGDTLRRLADKITDRLGGARVERSVMRDPRLTGVDLAGTVLVDADAHGKHLFVRFDDGRSLHAHLLDDRAGSRSVGRRGRASGSGVSSCGSTAVGSPGSPYRSSAWSRHRTSTRSPTISGPICVGRPAHPTDRDRRPDAAGRQPSR